ncbi:MAG: hypothetical protein ABI193_05765, partial [Minicystis sp.]
GSSATTTGTTSSGTTGTGGGATTSTTGTGGAMTTTSTTGSGGSGAGAPQGCKEFVLSGDPDKAVAATVPPASPGGLAWDGAHYEAVYTGTAPVGFNVYYTLLNPPGTILSPPGQQSLSLLGSDAAGGSIVAAGAHQGVLWSDRRTGDFEIFFSVLEGNGSKALLDDLRVTSAQGLSLNPSIAFNGSEFLAVWEDARNMGLHLFGQRISNEGALVGGNMEITKPAQGDSSEAPQIAAGPTNVGVAYLAHEAGVTRVAFQILGPDLAPSAVPPVTFEDAMGAPAAPTVVWNFDRYVIAWQDLKTPSHALRAVAIAPDGSTLVPPTEITAPGAHNSRAPRLLALGDSLLVVYADDRDDNGGYEIYARTLSPSLTPLSAELRVTSAMGDSVSPMIAAGPGAPFGDVGILFRDDRAAAQQNIFFNRIHCKSPGP